MGINAFTKTGNTVTFTAGVAAPTLVQVTNREQLKTVKSNIASATDVPTLQTAIAVTWTLDPDTVARQGASA